MAWDGSRVKGGGCGTNTSFVTKTADMSHLAGQSVMLRFSFFLILILNLVDGM